MRGNIGAEINVIKPALPAQTHAPIAIHFAFGISRTSFLYHLAHKFKEMPITQVEANHDALKVARGEIGGLAVERAILINDFEGRQNPALLDIVEFDGFIWEPDRNRRQ